MKKFYDEDYEEYLYEGLYYDWETDFVKSVDEVRIQWETYFSSTPWETFLEENFYNLGTWVGISCAGASHDEYGYGTPNKYTLQELIDKCIKRNGFEEKEEDNTMTREEKLTSMTKKMLIEEGKKINVKLTTKMLHDEMVKKLLEAERTQDTKEEETMKKEVNEAVEKAIAAIEDAEDVLEPVVEIKTIEEPREPENVQEAPKKRVKTLTYTETLAALPLLRSNLGITFKPGVNARANSVIVKQGKKRLGRVIGYADGTFVIATAKERVRVTDIRTYMENALNLA